MTVRASHIRALAAPWSPTWHWRDPRTGHIWSLELRWRLMVAKGQSPRLAVLLVCPWCGRDRCQRLELSPHGGLRCARCRGQTLELLEKRRKARNRQRWKQIQKRRKAATSGSAMTSTFPTTASTGSR